MLKVLDYAGKTVSELPAKTEPGLHRVTWNLMPGRPRPPARRPSSASVTSPQRQGGKAQPAGAEPEEPYQEALPFFGAEGQVKPGVYRVVLTVDGAELTQWVRVEPDPSEATTIIATDGDEEP